MKYPLGGILFQSPTYPPRGIYNIIFPYLYFNNYFVLRYKKYNPNLVEIDVNKNVENTKLYWVEYLFVIIKYEKLIFKKNNITITWLNIINCKILYYIIVGGINFV